MTRTQLQTRLLNWGNYQHYLASIGPDPVRCLSYESRYIQEAGNVWDDDETTRPTPNVADAEALDLYIRELSGLHRYALALEYGGAPCVLRWRRMGAYVHSHSLALAEVELCEMMRKRA